MIENTPPATHAATSSRPLSTAPATIEGVPKIPAPTMRPTIIVIASNSVSVGFGTPGCVLSAISALRYFIFGAAHLTACDELRRPVRLARGSAVADLHGAAHRVAAHLAAEVVAQIAGTAFRLSCERDFVATQAAP